jgi:hypothetical protein
VLRSSLEVMQGVWEPQHLPASPWKASVPMWGVPGSREPLQVLELEKNIEILPDSRHEAAWRGGEQAGQYGGSLGGGMKFLGWGWWAWGQCQAPAGSSSILFGADPQAWSPACWVPSTLGSVLCFPMVTHLRWQFQLWELDPSLQVWG